MWRCAWKLREALKLKHNDNIDMALVKLGQWGLVRGRWPVYQLDHAGWVLSEL